MRMMHALNRRQLIGSGLLFAASPLLAQEVVKAIADLKPGEFTWHPERSPEGPVAIVVSVPDQRVHVYRNGIRIAVSTCSTGKPGHETPTGVFTILQKDKDHHSSTYNNAPMPNMNRLTWDGVALHAGKLPGYPASHGCVRLPLAFSEKLFGVTHVGTPVIVAGAHSDPVDVVHPGLVLGSYAETEFESAAAALKGKALPEWSGQQTATSILISGADQQALLLENGRQVAAARISLEPGRQLGEHVFVLVDTHEAARGLLWHGIGYADAAGKPVEPPEGSILKSVGAEPDFRRLVHDRLHPGALFITTALTLKADQRTQGGFVIMTA
jgi:hypothetical protein